NAAALTGTELLELAQTGQPDSVKATTAAIAALAPLPPSNRLIPAGGTTGQALAKVDGTDYNVSWQTISGGGGGTGSALFSGARVRKSGTQAVGTDTVITWDVEDYDTSNYHSTVTNTSRMTAPLTGVYDILASLDWSAAGFIDCRLRVNGTTFISN